MIYRVLLDKMILNFLFLLILILSIFHHHCIQIKDQDFLCYVTNKLIKNQNNLLNAKIQKTKLPNCSVE